MEQLQVSSEQQYLPDDSVVTFLFGDKNQKSKKVTDELTLMKHSSFE